mmetsp:Transcript_56127/g.133713  ORF Transcript_56127/g.133713 Transcript_56127/m.133713 type:complete len:337 (+) Transcript_56127:149-1159(+)
MPAGYQCHAGLRIQTNHAERGPICIASAPFRRGSSGSTACSTSVLQCCHRRLRFLSWLLDVIPPQVVFSVEAQEAASLLGSLPHVERSSFPKPVQLQRRHEGIALLEHPQDVRRIHLCRSFLISTCIRAYQQPCVLQQTKHQVVIEERPLWVCAPSAWLARQHHVTKDGRESSLQLAHNGARRQVLCAGTEEGPHVSGIGSLEVAQLFESLRLRLHYLRTELKPKVSIRVVFDELSHGLAAVLPIHHKEVVSQVMLLDQKVDLPELEILPLSLPSLQILLHSLSNHIFVDRAIAVHWNELTLRIGQVTELGEASENGVGGVRNDHVFHHTVLHDRQ